MKISNVKISEIEQNENSRVIYKSVDLSELMLSLKKDGLLQPIGVKKLGPNSYEAVWGNRRLLAAKKLGWTEIPAHVVELEDELERDFIGLIENMKRQGTTVAEDGRIFQSLIDRGLSESEIAVRLDVPELRVKTAIEVYGEVPEEFRPNISYSGDRRSKKTKNKTIPASTAIALLKIRKNAGLNRAQMRTMFQYASENGTTVDVFNRAAPLLKDGVTIAQAVEQVADKEKITLAVYMKTRDIRKLEAAGGFVHEKMYEVLQKNFKCERAKFSSSKMKHDASRLDAISEAHEVN